MKMSWERPFTAKRYLHPPMAEKMVTMWPDFRVMCGTVSEQQEKMISSAFRVLAGKELEPPDFRKVQYEVNRDGVPVHAISCDLGEYILRMECFCNVGRVPVTYAKISLLNKTVWDVPGEMAIMPRTGEERHLTGMEVDGYARFDNNTGNWGFLPCSWHYEEGCLTDGEYEIRFQGMERFQPVWQGNTPGEPWHRRHLLKLAFALAPGEEISFTAAFQQGAVEPFHYEEEKEHAIAFWSRELAKIRIYPKMEADNVRTMYRTLVAQCLQMFCHPAGKDYVLPRQGGMQRAIWPVEALEFLIALDRIGDFFNYTESAYELFFTIMQIKEGENAGKIANLPHSIEWASITGGALWGLARHLLFANDRSVYNKYRESALLAFHWMERQRKTKVEGAIPGLFPPMKATDWDGGVYQSWCFTDTNNVIGYQWLAQAFDYYGDPASEEIRKAYQDYMSCLRQILAEEAARNSLEDEILISNRAGQPITDPPPGPYTADGPAYLLRAGIMEPESETARLAENYFRNRGMMQNGLTGLMNDGQLRQGHRSDPWAGHTWYTSTSDYCWFEHWLRVGRRDEAGKTLKAQLKYGMTPEFYMMERYADNDPYFVPWMPNASANGRTIMMLCDFFGEQTE